MKDQRTYKIKILISGYYGFKNTGDELILSKIIDDIKTIDKNAEIVVWSGDVENTKAIHNIKAINRFSLDETKNSVKWSDVVVVGGGGLIHEYFNLDIGDLFTNFGYNVAAYSIVPFLANIYRKPVFYWSHGVGPIFSDEAKQFCGWFYSLSNCTTARDEYSYALINDVYPEIKNLYLDSDPAVKLDFKKFIGKKRFGLPKNKLKLGINIRPWFGKKKMIDTVANALMRLLEERDNIIVVPVAFDLALDKEALKTLLDRLPKDRIVKDSLEYTQSFADVISLVDEVDIFVGTRLHSLIAANSLKKPTVGIIYDKKVESVAEKLSIPHVFIGSLNEFSLYSLIDRLADGLIKPVEADLDYKTPEIFAEFIKGQLKKPAQKKENRPKPADSTKIYENFIQSLKNENQQLVGEKNIKQAELEGVLQEKNQLVEKFGKLSDEKEKMQAEFDNVVSEKNSIAADKEKLATELVQTVGEKNIKQAELEGALQEKNQLQQQMSQIIEEKNRLFQLLDDIYSSDFWKIANFYYRIKEKSKGLQTIVHIAGKLKKMIPKKKASINIAASDMSVKKDIKSNAGENENPLTERQDNTKSTISYDADFHKYYENLVLPETTDKYDILFFSIIDWNFRFQRPQQIASRFADKGHRVFYLKTSFISDADYNIKELSKNIYEVCLPYNKISAIYSDDLENDLGLLTTALFNLIKDYSIKEHIYFVEFPMWYRLVKATKDRFNAPVAFDVLDEFSGFSNVHKEISTYEKKMLDISNSVITSSALLYNKTKSRFKDCYLVKNGTDFRHFSGIRESDLLKDIKKPIIGYYGAISEWFDTELVEYAARRHPEWSFVLIGHTFGAKINRLQKLDNVHFFGEKPYSELPNYLCLFDVCLIPFKNIPLIKSTNPVKFYEYISAGKPVVATKMDELIEFKDIAYIADNRDDFVKKIEIALKEDGRNGLVETRKSLAKKNDWGKRVYAVEKIIKDSFPKTSIIIVTYNNLEYTKLCIRSILEKTAYPNYEVIIVDNNSDNSTKEYLKNIAGNNIHIIFNDKNLGFAKANNMGIKKSSGEYVILLNNDTIVTRGWIGDLLRHFRGSVGMVGPVTNSIGNEAKINVSYNLPDDIEAFAEYYTGMHFGEEFEIKVLAMFCVAIKRETIEKVGLLDDRYGIGMFEDDDYAMALKNAGYKLLCAEDVFIHHFGNATFKKMKNEKYMKLFGENRKKFEEKWKVKWEAHKYRDGVS